MLMKNRNAPCFFFRLVPATAHAERDEALEMLRDSADARTAHAPCRATTGTISATSHAPCRATRAAVSATSRRELWIWRPTVPGGSRRTLLAFSAARASAGAPATGGQKGIRKRVEEIFGWAKAAGASGRLA